MSDEKPAPLEPELVREFVVEGHGDLDGVKDLLLDQGARIDGFAAAMLGQLEVVRAILDADPAARDARGPHGIPLVAHPRAGGAADVVALLEAA